MLSSGKGNHGPGMWYNPVWRWLPTDRDKLWLVSHAGQPLPVMRVIFPNRILLHYSQQNCYQLITTANHSSVTYRWSAQCPFSLSACQPAVSRLWQLPCKVKHIFHNLLLASWQTHKGVNNFPTADKQQCSNLQSLHCQSDILPSCRLYSTHTHCVFVSSSWAGVLFQFQLHHVTFTVEHKTANDTRAAARVTGVLQLKNVHGIKPVNNDDKLCHWYTNFVRISNNVFCLHTYYRRACNDMKCN